MATFYFDSSGLVKHYIPERGSAWVTDLIDAGTQIGDWQHDVIFAKIGIVGVAAAVAKRQRMGDITLGQQRRFVARFLKDCSDRFTTLRTNDALIRFATDLTQHHPLRGYDAVHLAAALTLNTALLRKELPPLVFISADNTLCQAALVEGLAVENPNAHK